ncbi:hypothetical protein TNCV_4888131 [Trichonephila clavipes]|nr:hypothetical protein TNCV_4888131 [Trichonephila clavipes]
MQTKLDTPSNPKLHQEGGYGDYLAVIRWVQSFGHPPYSPDPLTTKYHFFKHLENFLSEKCFRSPMDAETDSMRLANPKQRNSLIPT